MSSDAESKGDSTWRVRWLMLVSFLAGSLLGPLFGISLPGFGPRPFVVDVSSRALAATEAHETERALRKAPVAGAFPPAPPAPLATPAPSAPPASPAPPTLEASAFAPPPALVPAAAQAAAAVSECDIAQMGLGIDPRFDARGAQLRESRGRRPYPTFDELYEMIVNKPYSAERNIWHTFPNAYNLTSNFHFPYSNLKKPHINRVIELLGRPAKFAVEVGSFHGHSAIWQALVLDQHELKDTPLLCIDPWTGALGMLLNRDDWDKKLTPGEIADGRSTSYWQFMLNIKAQIDQKTIGPKHIVPLVATSIVGARYLLAMGLTPDMIFLDSAHEKDETFIELSLYYRVLAEGGVLFGDDLSWDSVKHDVLRFAKMHGLKLETSDEGVIWMIKKPIGAAVGLAPAAASSPSGNGRRRRSEPQQAV